MTGRAIPTSVRSLRIWIANRVAPADCSVAVHKMYVQHTSRINVTLHPPTGTTFDAMAHELKRKGRTP